VTQEGIGGWFDDFAHSGNYDANGVVARISTTFNVFSPSAPGGLPNLLAPALDTLPEQLASGLSIDNLRRCPGGNERPAPDGSNPFTDNGTLNCDPSQIPPGS
jgi:hypothetical protein